MNLENMGGRSPPKKNFFLFYREMSRILIYYFMFSIFQKIIERTIFQKIIERTILQKIIERTIFQKIIERTILQNNYITLSKKINQKKFI
jgi:hypothetical protein